MRNVGAPPEVGTQLRLIKRPEWGIGTVRSIGPATAGTTTPLNIVIDFHNVGERTLRTGRFDVFEIVGGAGGEGPSTLTSATARRRLSRKA